MTQSGQIYRLLAKIGINGKKDARFLCIFYLVILIGCALTYLYADLPKEILWVVLLFPPVFIGAAITLVAIRLFFIYFYNNLTVAKFILFCITMLLLWSLALSFWQINIDNKNLLQLITWLIPTVGIPIFLCLSANLYLYEKYKNSKKGSLKLLVAHAIITLLLLTSIKTNILPVNPLDTKNYLNTFIFITIAEVFILLIPSCIFCIILLSNTLINKNE